MSRRRVGLVYGGQSGEHEISVRSARSVVDAIDRERFELILIGVGRDGRWYRIQNEAIPVGDAVAPGHGPEVVAVRGDAGGALVTTSGGARVAEIDIFFPVLHGPYGEDGTVQGLFEVLGMPYVGAGVLGSAIGMDKDVHKRLLREAGLPIVPYAPVRIEEWRADSERVLGEIDRLGDTVFVKPANLGSSVGISKVRDRSQLAGALETAFRFDRKAVVEAAVDAREIECAVLGNSAPEASLPGEIVPGEDFYSYDDKYASGSAAQLIIPAPLSEEQTTRIRGLATRVFRVLELRGLARVDFFVERTSGEVFVNEPNTMPGFTSISMYPKMWAATGLPYRDLVSRLIELGFEDFESRPRG